MKIGILLLIVILSVSLVSALQISVSPSHININKLNSKICKEVTVSSDRNIDVYLEDRWSNAGKGFNDYNLSSKDFDVEINYPKTVYVNDEETVDVCITANKKGTYNGTLLFKSENVGVGILLKVNTGENLVNVKSLENNSDNLSYTKITSNNVDKKSNSQFMLIILAINSLLLLSLLILLISLAKV